MYKFRTFLVAVAAAFALSVAGASAQPANDRLITETTMGDAIVGSTASQLEAQLGPDYDVAPATTFVDTEGVEVTFDGVRQFLAFHVAGEGPELTFLATDNPEYQLANGIGPGTSIADAAAILGAPTVSFNTESESREFVTFADAGDTRIQFQVVGPDGSETAGEYAESGSSFNESTDIKEGATIQRIWVSCSADGCPTVGGGDTLPETGSSDGTLPLVIVASAMLLGGAIIAASGHRSPTVAED